MQYINYHHHYDHGNKESDVDTNNYNNYYDCYANNVYMYWLCQ